jgi:hypothetical protein
MRFVHPNTTMLDCTIISSHTAKHCHCCGAPRSMDWKCEYCQTTYSDAPRFFGKPISHDELRVLIQGGQIDIDAISIRQ